MRGFPRTSSRHLGMASVSGLMRSPRPAARIIAFMPRVSERISHALPGRLELVEQACERGELPVASAGAPQVVHHPGLVFQVAVLSVPEGEPRKDSQHLELPLDPHPLEVPVKLGKISGDRKFRAPRLLPVSDCPVDDALLLPGDEI